MTKAQDRLIKSIWSRNFEKLISVAHKDNGKDFFYKLRLLYFFLFCLYFPLQFLLVVSFLTLACVAD